MPKPPQNNTTFIRILPSSEPKTLAHLDPSQGYSERMETVEIAVVGAGVVGLAIARALARQGREVVVLESERAIGQHTSSRNSEVVHAGFYYAPGSLKARLCQEG